MKLYIATLRIRSALGTPLTADTLWGHVAWGIRRRSGSRALEHWIEQHESDAPPLVLSDPYPQGYLPRPHLPATGFASQASKSDAANAKRLSKLKWLPNNGFQSICQRVSPFTVQQWIMTAESSPEYPRDWMSESTRIRIGVHRFTGGTEMEDGGAVFESREWATERGALADVWVASPSTAEQVQQWLTWGTEGGYGRDSTAGLGHIVCTQVTEARLPAIENPNAVMILGTWVPQPSEPCVGFVQMATKQGRVGGDYSMGSGEKRKYPIRYIGSGSIVLTQSPQIVGGRLLRNIHPDLKHIVFPGISIWLPISLAPEVVHEVTSDTKTGATLS